MVMHECVNLEPPLGYTISNQPHMIVQYATNACNRNISPCTKVGEVQQIEERENRKIEDQVAKSELNQPAAGFNIMESWILQFELLACKSSARSGLFIYTQFGMIRLHG